jgi:exopolysaccharide production protein ExoZ
MAGEKIQSLQAMRFGAAAMVVAVHAIYFVRELPPAPDVSGGYAGIGASGVDIFFVISGFVIYRSALKGPSAAAFLRKRFLRIAPFYYLTTLTFFPLFAFSGWPMPDAQSIATSLTFWPAWDHLASPIDPVGWSLCFEMLFYGAAAAGLRWRSAMPVLLAGFAAAWIARLHFGWPALRFIGNPIIIDFLFGVLIAARWRQERIRSIWYGYTLLLLGFTGLYIFCLPAGHENARFVIDGTQSFTRVLSWGIPATAIVNGSLALEPYLKGAWVKWIVYLGDASYSIYLVHWPLLVVVSWILKDSGTPQSMLLAPILFVLGTGTGVAAYQFIEIPLSAAMNRTRTCASTI